MTTLVGQIKMETKLFLRDKRSLFFTFAFPVIMVLIFGSAFGDQTVVGVTGHKLPFAGHHRDGIDDGYHE